MKSTFFPPGRLAMKTLFQMGMPGSFNFWAQPMPRPMLMRRPFLGQAIPTGDLDEATKNDVYARLKDAVTKGMEIDNWIHTIGEDGQRAAFGSSFDTWRGYINSAADQAETVYPIYQRLWSDNQEDWWIASEDSPKITFFIDTVNNAWQMYQKGKAALAAPPATVTKTPTPTGVPVAPSSKPATLTPVGSAAATKPIMPQPGVSTNDILIGGGLAVGVGVVLYAL